MLIFWDHGGGSISGYGYDEKNAYAGSMNLAGLNTAFRDGGVKFDFIGFDACLMATMETALMLDEHPQIVDAIEKNPNALVEFLDRTNLLHLFENARIQSLQSAKDKEIAALKTKLNETLASHDTFAADQEVKMAELRSANETLSAEIAEKSQALDAAKAEAEQLASKYADATKALADAQAALAAETERYREQVGLALQPKPEGSEPGKSGLALVRCSFPSEKR
jgi:hypothetical protein